MLDDVLLATSSAEHERVTRLFHARTVEDCEIDVVILQVDAPRQYYLIDLPHLGFEQSRELWILDHTLFVQKVFVLVIQVALPEKFFPVRIVQEHFDDTFLLMLDRYVQAVFSFAIQQVDWCSSFQQDFNYFCSSLRMKNGFNKNNKCIF